MPSFSSKKMCQSGQNGREEKSASSEADRMSIRHGSLLVRSISTSRSVFFFLKPSGPTTTDIDLAPSCCPFKA